MSAPNPTPSRGPQPGLSLIAYYLQLGWRSLRRNPVLTALMVIGIGLGIAASMTTLTVLHLTGADPIPWKSDRLHYVQLDNWSAEQPARDDGSPPDQVTYRDAMALMSARKADKQAAMFKLSLPIQPENRELKPFQALGRVTYADFFAMFEPPFQFGAPWNRDQDEGHARVVVLTRALNEKLFGGQDSTGRSLRMNDVDYTIVGVLDEWKLRFRYYDVTNGAFADPDEFFMPLTTAVDLKQRSTGNNSCWQSPGDGWEAYLNSDCVWLQMWVQLDTPARLAEYRDFLNSYVSEQKKLGRFPRPLNNRLLDVNQWIVDQRVVSRDMEVQTGLAFAFLAVCLVNTIGLLLATFTRKAGEIGLRRALGASRADVFRQFLVESGVVGLSGGVLGLGLTALGLVAVRALYSEYRSVAQLDWTMVLTTIALAVVSAVLAGLYPTWRACRVQPAAQLKV